jgi:hypothetical protein
MEEIPSWQANSFSASKEIHSILWNPKVYNRVYNSPPLIPIPNQINQVHPRPLSWRPILIVFSNPRQGLLNRNYQNPYLVAFFVSQPKDALPVCQELITDMILNQRPQSPPISIVFILRRHWVKNGYFVSIKIHLCLWSQFLLLCFYSCNVPATWDGVTGMPCAILCSQGD